MKQIKSIFMVAVLLMIVAFSVTFSRKPVQAAVIAPDDDCAICYQKGADAYQACIQLGINSGMCHLMSHSVECDCFASKHCVVMECDMME